MSDVIQTMCSYLRPQRSWGKVMFLHMFVILFTGRWWAVSRPTPRGEVEGSGQGGVSRSTPRGMSARGVFLIACWDTLPPTTTAAGGTHPTGMHSCLHFKITSTLNICALVLARIGFISQASTGLDQFLDSYEHLLTSFQQQM